MRRAVGRRRPPRSTATRRSWSTRPVPPIARARTNRSTRSRRRRRRAGADHQRALRVGRPPGVGRRRGTRAGCRAASTRPRAARPSAAGGPHPGAPTRSERRPRARRARRRAATRRPTQRARGRGSSPAPAGGCRRCPASSYMPSAVVSSPRSTIRLSATRAVPSAMPNSAHHCTSRLRRHPGRLHPEQQAPDQRPGDERPVEQLDRPCITFLHHLFEKCNIASRDRHDDAARARGARRRSTRTERLTANGRPAPRVARRAAPHPERAQRVRVVVALRADDRDHRRRGVDRQPGSCGSPRSCSWAARTRSSRRSCTRPRTACCSATSTSTTGSAAGCSASRRSRRSTSTAAGTWRTTATSSVPTSPTSRSTAATRSPRDSMRRKLVRDATGRTGLEAVQGPAAGRRVRPTPPVRSQARRIVGDAARAHRDRHRARSPVGVLHPVARAVPHGVARHQPAALDRRARRHAALEGPPRSPRTRCGSTRSPGSSSCRSTSAGTSRTTSTPASRWRTCRSCTPSSRARAT